MKKVAILQSNYIPWKGYFDIINMVDEFVFYDHVKYTKNDWRNRNKIKSSNGSLWLTIPVRHKGSKQKIDESESCNDSWRRKHWESIKQNYSKAKFFSMYHDVFKSLYLDSNDRLLSKINSEFIISINKILGVNSKIRWSSEFEQVEGKTKNIINICKQCKADVYVSGPSAINYFDLGLAEQEGLSIEWVNYSNYPIYSQLHTPFEHNVSILDLIFNEGPNAKKFMKSFGI